MAVSIEPKPSPGGTPSARTDLGEVAVRLTDVHFTYPLMGVSLRKKLTGALPIVGGQLHQHRRRVEIRALEGIDLELRRGQRLGIMGHNGAGKSTMLRLIAGIYHARSGKVEVFGRVAAVFDKMLGMDPEMTGYDNIRVRGMFLGLTDGEIEHRVEEIAEFCELGEYLHLPLRIYSPGMRARLGFSTCTAFDADVLVLDEWMGVGDKRFRERAHDRMREFYQRAGTVILVSHNDQLIEENCDSAIVMEHGRIVDRFAITPPEEGAGEETGERVAPSHASVDPNAD